MPDVVEIHQGEIRKSLRRTQRILRRVFGGLPRLINLALQTRVSAIYTMEGRPVPSIELDNFKGVLWAAVSPDGKKLACSTDRGNIHVYDIKNGEARSPLPSTKF